MDAETWIEHCMSYHGLIAEEQIAKGNFGRDSAAEIAGDSVARECVREGIDFARGRRAQQECHDGVLASRWKPLAEKIAANRRGQ